MWSRTPYLEYLVIAATIAPAELVRVVTSFDTAAAANRVRMARMARFGVPACYLLVTSIAIAVALMGRFLPGYLTEMQIDWRWLLFATAVGCLLVALELAVGALPAMIRGARRIQAGIATGFGAAGLGYLTSIMLTAVAEEVLYRGIWIGVLREVLEVPAAIAIGSAALAYGLGHLFFGFQQVLQKVVAGTIFGVLLVTTGSLLVPILAHIAQNLVVFGLAVRQSGRNGR
jgi:membrane protease YdiL (CAAX protease family)